MSESADSHKNPRAEVDRRAMRISAWASLLEALDQEAPQTLRIPSYVLGEAGRSINRDILRIQELLDE